MAILDLKLEAWKNKLLDLGKRNRLLNYRDTKRSNLQIKQPTIFELWDSFAVNEQPLEFPYYDDDRLSMLENEEGETLEASILTNQTIKEQQITLRSLREKAKTAMEEQGVNILYLSFGFLRWREDVHSEEYFLSPIVLAPAVLTLESITSPFVLRLHEDEITLNPTLVYKLSNDFGIDLPDLDPDNDLIGYFNRISDLVKGNKWEVIDEAGISLLSFLKINMYRDLEVNKDKIKSNPVVRALTGDVTGIENTYEDINNYNHDRESAPVDLFQIVDADSSQQDAIILAKKGISFVLQGPPGTGKSQTITNIIAECLASGKKVLFVSEKMAALEVVRKRLTAAGLADFCLTLHSYKANKKEVLDQLSKVLNLSRQRANLSDDAFRKLDLLQEYKEKLNEYAQQIYEVVEPLGKTIYQVNGYLAHLESYDNIVFDIDDIGGTTLQKFNRYINLLAKFAGTIGKMSDSYKENPWNDANISAVTNEHSHDIGAYLPKLLPKIMKVSHSCDGIFAELPLKNLSSYTGLEEICEILALSSQSPQAPIDWIVGDDIALLGSEIDKYQDLNQSCQHTQSEISAILADLSAFDPSIHRFDPLDLVSSTQIVSEIDKLTQVLNTSYPAWLNGNYGKAQTAFAEARQIVGQMTDARDGLLTVFEGEILDIDFKPMLSRFKTDYGSWLKIFSRQYKADKKVIQGLYKQIVRKVSDEDSVKVLMSLKGIDEARKTLAENRQRFTQYFGEGFAPEDADFQVLSHSLKAFALIELCKEKLTHLLDYVQSIENREGELRERFNYLYRGITTDWKKARQSLSWANDFRKLHDKYGFGKEFIESICTNDEKIALCSGFLSTLTEAKADLDGEFQWYLNLFHNKEEIRNIPMPALYDRVLKGLGSLALLEEWIDFRDDRKKCQQEGLTDYIDKVEQLSIGAENIVPLFKKRFYRLWLDALLPHYPAVLNFRRRVQERTIDDFASLDELQFSIAKARLKKKLIDDMPSFDRVTSGVDELNILKRELGKQRRIKPIRKLFREIPNLLLTLKPCLMMSPLSVSLFLEAGSYDFDTIIFDEASQVCTENAIGAISRGKQVVIAGDSKQLPPTNFFNASNLDEDFDSDIEEDDEYDDINAYESILEEASLLPERTLLWHYRSRHEHLIAFSNAKIYKNSLITFPANVERIPDNGVEYIYVADGFYDRGGKRGNVPEAKRIVQLVFEHYSKFPNRSLGVIAFGEVQQQAIDTVLRQRRKEDQRFEFFFKEDHEEAFFVKNLENVQGDERDTIIFSVGYARDATGKFTMNFGPLSKNGGERRLNVAITRAKHNVKLVGSILPTDIEVERVSLEGPKLLRSYIDFAMNGPSVLLRETTESDGVQHDSPFEAAVYNFLDRKGYKLATQVGCSGYRIDMAVKHPSINGRYGIGIECDGAAYHSARTARERDRLRQAVLEDMGWIMYRIWSTDWIKDPVTEGQKLVEAIEMAIRGCADEAENRYSVESTTVIDGFLSMDEREIGHEDGMNSYGFEGQEQTDFAVISRDEFGYINIGDCIKATVENEYPLHYEVLCKKLAPLYGNEKATIKVRRQVDDALLSLLEVVRKGDFFYPAGDVRIVPKPVGNTRLINQISLDELAEALFIIASKSYGILKDNLLQAAAREYGFARSGEKIQIAMQKAYGVLLESGRIKEADGKVAVNSPIHRCIY